MKRRVTVICIAIVSIFALAFIGYTVLSSATKPQSSVLKSIENAQNIYIEATSKTDPAQDLVMHVSITKEMTVDDSLFLEVSEQSIHYDIQPTGDKRILLQETITSGSHSIHVSEIFNEGVVYTTINDTPFTSACSTAEYYATLTPTIILTQQLYSSISGIDNGEDYIIYFSEPTGIENWLENQAATLLNASGTATISYDGALKSSMYTVSYEENEIVFRTTVLVDIQQGNTDVTLPDDPAQYTQISYWKGPKLLERACGYLLQADRISSSYADSIYFQAFGDRRTQTITQHAHKDSQWSVSISTDVALRNDTKQDQVTTHTKQELFIDNQYSVSNDGSTFENNPEITVDAVYNYFQDQLVSTLVLPQHIDSADVAENENTLQINFTGTEAFGNFLTENVCRILYNDPSLITKTEATLSVKNMQCYLEIDKLSGLPLASGIHFLGDYKAEGLPYRIEYSADQSYVIPSNSAINEIKTAAGQ